MELNSCSEALKELQLFWIFEGVEHKLNGFLIVNGQDFGYLKSLRVVPPDNSGFLFSCEHFYFSQVVELMNDAYQMRELKGTDAMKIICGSCSKPHCRMVCRMNSQPY